VPTADMLRHMLLTPVCDYFTSFKPSCLFPFQTVHFQ